MLAPETRQSSVVPTDGGARSAAACRCASFLLRFVRNPLSSLPRAVYEDGIVVHDNGRGVVAWVTDPALIEEVLLSRAEQFPKTPLEKQVFENTLGDGILTSQGPSWRWQRRTAAPLFRPADLANLVPAMSAAAERPVAALARRTGRVHPGRSIAT